MATVPSARASPRGPEGLLTRSGVQGDKRGAASHHQGLEFSGEHALSLERSTQKMGEKARKYPLPLALPFSMELLLSGQLERQVSALRKEVTFFFDCGGAASESVSAPAIVRGVQVGSARSRQLWAAWLFRSG